MVVGLSLRAFRNSIENWFPNEFISVLAVCSQKYNQGGSHDSSVGSMCILNCWRHVVVVGVATTKVSRLLS